MSSTRLSPRPGGSAHFGWQCTRDAPPVDRPAGIIRWPSQFREHHPGTSPVRRSGPPQTACRPAETSIRQFASPIAPGRQSHARQRASPRSAPPAVTLGKRRMVGGTITVVVVMPPPSVASWDARDHRPSTARSLRRAGATNSSKQTRLPTGLPGNPKTRQVLMRPSDGPGYTPNHIGLPGFNWTL